MRPLLYVIGASGVGKSTTINLLLGNLNQETIEKPIHHVRYTDTGAIQLGRKRQIFGGTDTLPMDANPRAIQLIRDTSAPAVIAEGDRLANARFFQAALDAGYSLQIAYLVADEQETARRRQERGHQMRETFVKGRRTKCENIAREWAQYVTRVPADAEPQEVAAALRTFQAIMVARGD